MPLSIAVKKVNAERLKQFNNLCLIAQGKNMPFDVYIKQRADYRSAKQGEHDLFIAWMAEAQKHQQQVKQYVSPSYFNDADATLKHLAVRAGVHDKPGFSSPIVDEAYDTYGVGLRRQGIIAPAFDQAQQYRHRIKYTVSIAPLPYVQADGGLRVISTINAVAPNLMGTSPIDEQMFLENITKDLKGKMVSAKLKDCAYKAACEEIANLAALSAKDNGINGLVVADFGLGVYLKNLSPTDQITARRIMQQAYAAATENHGIKLKWVIWEDDPQRENKLRQTESNLGRFSHCMVTPGDIITGINELTQDAEAGSWAVINNGSDRTIGGAKDAHNPSTAEEQLAQASLLLPLQSALNPHVNDCVQKVTQQQLTGESPVVATDAIKLPSSAAEQGDGKKANTYGDLLGRPVRTGKAMQYFAFVDQRQAQQVLEQLKTAFPTLENLNRATVQLHHGQFQFGLTHHQVGKIQTTPLSPVAKSDEPLAQEAKPAEQEAKSPVLKDLELYQKQRAQYGKFYAVRGFLSIFASQSAYSKTTKLSAAQKLENHIKGTETSFTADELKALKDGALGKIVKEHAVYPLLTPRL